MGLRILALIKAKTGPQAGSIAQHNKLYWVVLGQDCRRGKVSLSRKPSKDSGVGGATSQKGKRSREITRERGLHVGAGICDEVMSQQLVGNLWVRGSQRAAVIWGLL